MASSVHDAHELYPAISARLLGLCEISQAIFLQIDGWLVLVKYGLKQRAAGDRQGAGLTLVYPVQLRPSAVSM